MKPSIEEITKHLKDIMAIKSIKDIEQNKLGYYIIDDKNTLKIGQIWRNPYLFWISLNNMSLCYDSRFRDYLKTVEDPSGYYRFDQLPIIIRQVFCILNLSAFQ